MPRSYREIIRLIQNGDPVDSSINSILESLAGNTDYVKLLLEEALLGQMILAREQSVDEGVKVGQPVYFDKTDQVFKRAYAQASVDTTTGEFVTSDTTQVLGVCHYKHNSTSADILLMGLADIDMSEAIDGNTAGIYYLSGTAAGKLVNQEPPVSVPVLFWDGDSKVFVNPSLSNVFTEHQHYKFSLQAVTAGTHVVPSPGGHHVISPADDSIEGWLPADHEIFEGKAPAGAKFGYNLSASQLERLWPPMPLGSCTISWVRPGDGEAGSADLPGNQISSGSETVNQTFTDGTTTSVAITVSPSTSVGVPYVFDSVFTDEGLEVVNVAVGTNEVTFDVVNNTGADVAINDTVEVLVFNESTFTVTAPADFQEDTVPDGLCVMDNNGIWWMSDCYGLVPWPVDYGSSPSEDSPVETLVWADAGYPAIMRSELDGSDILAVVYGEGVKKIRDVAIDTDNAYVYATTTDSDSIVRVWVNETQTHVETIYSSSTGTVNTGPWGIALGDDKIYFTDSSEKKLFSINTDGTGLTTLATGLTDPRGVSYDATNGHIYYIDDSKIVRCDDDGANSTDVLTGLGTPYFLIANGAGNTLTWTDYSLGTIKQSTLAGASITTLVSGQTEPRGIAANGTHIYWTTGDDKLKRATTAGASVSDIVTLHTTSDPHGLQLASLDPPSASLCGDLDMVLTLWFTKTQFQTANTAVTSLIAAENSGLSITCVHNGEEATRGDLEIDLDLSLLVDDDDDEEGYQVFKRFEGNRFYRGAAVTGVKSGTSNVSVSGEATVDGYAVGNVTVSVASSAISAELPVEHVRLNGVEEENYQDTLGLSFREGVDAEYRAKVNIPASYTGDTVKIKLRFQVLVRADGDIPALTLTARSFPRPGQTTATAESLPTSDSAVTLSVASATGMSEDTYIELQSAEITSSPGASVLFTLSRAGSSDSFAGELHVIDQRAVVTSVS